MALGKGRAGRRRCGFCTLVVLLLACGFATAASAASVRAVTYNILWGQETSAKTGRWTGEIDLRRTARDIKRSGAEVVALQEAQSYRIGQRTFSEPHELARLLGWTHGGTGRHVLFRGSSPTAIWCRKGGRAVVRRISGRRASCTAHGNAILTRRNMANGVFINLFRSDGTPANGDAYGAVEGRSALRARISVGARTVWVATTHLAREPHVSTCQLRDLVSQLESTRPLVLLGDFNLQTTTAVARPRCQGVPPRPLDQMTAAGYTRGTPGGRTYPAFRPREHIDHVFVTSPLGAGGVRPLNNCDRRRCSSDHRPITARLSVPD